MNQINYQDLKKEIFCAETFTEKLNSGSSEIEVYKDTIQTAQNHLDNLFRNNTCVRYLIFARAWLIDQILQHAWNNLNWQDDDISMIAVGGYGRGELHPHSDIDLLILYKRSVKKHRTNIEQFLAFLWDIGLKVGHSVRSIKQCRDEAKKDITVTTSIIEARLLTGNNELLPNILKRTGPNKMWSSSMFFEAKRQEQQERHQKYNDTEYNLEPNVKESPGGLRDIQMINWVAKRHFGGNNLHDLVLNNFLSEIEFKHLTEAQDYLWKIRYGLHILAGRPEDRLLFDHQRQLAELFNYKDDDESLAIEKLTQEFYCFALRITQLNEMLLQHFDEAIIHANDKPEERTLNSRFKITNNYIEVVDNQVFQRTPFALMEIFLLLAQHPEIKGVRASTIRLIRGNSHLIDDDFRKDSKNTSIFMQLMRSPQGLITQLQRMRRYTILGRYLPEFKKIIGKMQYDLFHIYTVDAHTLLLLEYIRRISTQSATTRFPLASKIMVDIPKPELLYIAALYHDIAKGRGGDHSKLGAVDTQLFCQRHLINTEDTKLVVWLVKNHLQMSMTAQRKDITDITVIQQFAHQMKDQQHLDYLFILTVADINATNPKLWNSWRSSLLRQLYLETKHTLNIGLENPTNQKKAISKKQAEALLTLPFNPRIIQTYWDQLGDDYFIQHSAADISWHTLSIFEHSAPDKPLIKIQQTNKDNTDGGTKILIYSQDKGQLFTTIVSALEQLELNIVNAHINSWQKQSNIHTYVVLDACGNPIENNKQRIKQIITFLEKTLLSPNKLPKTTKRRTTRRLQHFTNPTEVNINEDDNLPYTVVEVVTPDRPGLLARIGHIFMNHNLILQKARLVTLGELVEDVFFISNKDFTPLNDKKLEALLIKEICTDLDQWAKPTNIQ